MKDKKETITSIDDLCKKAWDIRYREGKKALEFGKQALKLAGEIDYEHGRAQALLVTGLLEFWFAEGDQYLEKLLEAETLFQKTEDDLGQARSMTYIGSVYDTYGDYNKAIESCHKAVRICEKNGYEVEEADALAIIGQINMRIGDYQKAIESFEETLRIRSGFNDRMAMSSSYNLLARAHLLNNNFSQSEEYYNKSLELRKETGDTKGLTWTLLGLATLNEKKGDFQKAIHFYRQGLELNKEFQDKRYQLICNTGLSKILIKSGDENTAEVMLNESIGIAKEIHSKPVLADVCLVLSQLHEKKNDFKKSLEYYKEYNRLQESVNTTETANKLKNQQIAFSIEKAQKEAEIYQLRNVELKNAYDEVEKKNREIVDSINYARRIQRGILPSEELLKKLLPESMLFYLPRDIVSGDFYWLNQYENKIFFTAADCTGHGVPGALLSIIGKIGLDRAINEFGLTTPSLILDKLAVLLKETFASSGSLMKDGMDIALCAYDPDEKTLEFAGARNSLFLLRDHELIVYKADRQSIESSDELRPFTNHTIKLKKEDVVYIFSDGYCDQFGGPENKKFMTKNLKSLVTEIFQKPVSEQKSILENRFLEWKGGNEQIDDVCILGVRF
jgi:serine phosphatase RsbU (regulator of sigma subunit)